MTRGKNASKTENRERVIADREAPLRRRIEELERQVLDLDRANVAQQAVHAEANRKARVQIAANTSDRVQQLEAEVEAVSAERDQFRAEMLKVDATWQKVSNRLLERFFAETNNGEEALEKFFEYAGQAPGTLIVAGGEEKVAERIGSEGLRAIRRARRAKANAFQIG